MTDAISRLRALLDGAARIVVFTGAGISTESGIPDFRSPQGIWSQAKPIEFRDFLASAAMRREAWRRKIEIDRDIEAAAPNRGHRAVAALVARGRASCVITQNIDGLHQRSGVPDACVVELHGNGTYARCLDCGLRHELAPIKAAFVADGSLPHCRACGGLVKAATISFGQPMPEEAMTRAREETLACDLFLVLGSSLVVYPAAGFPLLAKRRGARLVILNREPTEQDEAADLALHLDIGPTLGAAIGVD
ncbi:MAG TPA: Sir2 family NAD-dependent protein deacetylase [Gammaproteobacteria bacterium]|mgnify:CR=1 FL=1|nr:Sir2 family NAD-dependent protein deacetylase [Gammaproteobacteria bacterium]